MVDVTNEDEFRAWLKSQPRETRATIAARIALRGMPYFIGVNIIGLKGRPRSIPYHRVLQPFWAASVALCSGIWPKINETHIIIKAEAHTDNDIARAASASLTLAARTYRHAHADVRVGAAIDAEAKVAADLIWLSLQNDIDILLESSVKTILQHSPLWCDSIMPVAAKSRWDRFRANLLEQDPNWSVWTEWYDALLIGNAPFIEEIEIGDPKAGKYGRCTFPEEYYQDPPRLNAALREVIDGYWAKTRGTIPPKKPASIRPVWKDGRLALNHNPLDPDLEAKLALANLQAVRDEMRELAADVRKRGNINADPADILDRTADLIPLDIPDAADLFRLIRKESILRESLSTVNEQ